MPLGSLIASRAAPLRSPALAFAVKVSSVAALGGIPLNRLKMVFAWSRGAATALVARSPGSARLSQATGLGVLRVENIILALSSNSGPVFEGPGAVAGEINVWG